MDTVHSKLKQSLTVGAKKGWGGFIWMLKIIVPISFLTILLEYSGWINKINFINACEKALRKLVTTKVHPEHFSAFAIADGYEDCGYVFPLSLPVD